MAESEKSVSSTLRVAVALPVKGSFSYWVPERLSGSVKPGCRVLVPFNNRNVTGYVLNQEGAAPHRKLKNIIDILDIEPVFLPHMIPFFEWIAEYYLCPIGMVIRAALPEAHYKTVAITPKGLEALNGRLFASEEIDILSWVKANPEKRLKWPLKKIYPLKEKGWLTLQNRSLKPTSSPKQLRFVMPEEDVDLKAVLAASARTLKAKNEIEFLTRVFDTGAIRAGELRARFNNGSYLINKWVKKRVLKVCWVPVHGSHGQANISPPPLPHELNHYQKKVLSDIVNHLDEGAFSSVLLHGVTGSGKTEVYCRAVEHTLRSGRRAILMAPEISLAMYLEGFFKLRLGDRIAIYHSGLTRREKAYQWSRMMNGEADLVIGARSAIFSPCPIWG
ncbi:MAG: DEAD/DEAH box helicase family protein [Deltaproteobacteria bacterium]|nr:DEAD/DEAH box helicase family protein [Deltaproteobacteria bacterium]